MIWIAPSEKEVSNGRLEKKLRDAADTATRVSASPECEPTWRDFRKAKDHWSADSGLRAQEYSASVIGLIFLRFAEVRFAAPRAKLENTLLKEQLKRFTTFAAASLERIEKLQTQIQNLRRTRDLLLPRLLSGQVNLTTN